MVRLKARRNKLKAEGMSMGDMLVDRSWDQNLETGMWEQSLDLHLNVYMACVSSEQDLQSLRAPLSEHLLLPPAAHDEEQPLMRNGGDVQTPGTGYSAHAMFQHPAKTLKWLEQRGCKKLGDFTVQVNLSAFEPSRVELTTRVGLSACAPSVTTLWAD